MKYRILVEKKNDKYLASCSSIESLNAFGDSFNTAIDNLQKNIFCYLHDPEAELEIVISKQCGEVLDLSKSKPTGTLL